MRLGFFSGGEVSPAQGRREQSLVERRLLLLLVPCCLEVCQQSLWLAVVELLRLYLSLVLGSLMVAKLLPMGFERK